jgi:hypothetical protein
MTFSVDEDDRSGVVSSDCIRPAPEMADIFSAVSKRTSARFRVETVITFAKQQVRKIRQYL